MKSKIGVLLFKVFLLSLPVLLLVCIYFLKDPFKVLYRYDSYFQSGKPLVITLNNDFVAVETYLTNREVYKYDSFIFGNSRSRFYEISDWKRHISSRNCYHFDASGESLYGIYKKIKLIKSKGDSIKNAMIVIDYGTLERIADTKGHLFLKHPVLTGGSRLVFQMEYIKIFFDKRFLFSYIDLLLNKKVKDYMKKESIFGDVVVDYSAIQNETRYLLFEQLIARDPALFYQPRKGIFYQRDSIQSYGKETIGEVQRQMLTEMAEMLSADGCSYKVIINPVYDQLKLNRKDLAFLESTFGKSNVFDFSGKNRITGNIYNYYELSHYRPTASRQIMDSVYSGKELLGNP